MGPIIAIKYTDALYYTEKKLGHTKLQTHVAVGKIAVFSDEYIALSFVEKNNIPEKGLLVPKEILILKDNNYQNFKKINLSAKKNSNIGVYWKDIIYFENGKIPNQPTIVYTEGKLFLITIDSIGYLFFKISLIS